MIISLLDGNVEHLTSRGGYKNRSSSTLLVAFDENKASLIGIPVDRQDCGFSTPGNFFNDYRSFSLSFI